MCDCLAWHHPLWKLVGKRTGAKPMAVWGIVAALQADPLLQGLSIKDKVSVLADGAGEKPMAVALILAGLQHAGVVDESGNLADEMPRQYRQNFVSRRRPGRPPLAERAMTGAERTAKWQAKRGGARGASAVVTADENTAGISSATPSFFLVPEDSLQAKEQKQTRASADDTGFVELWAIWPVQNRMADAERAYLKYLRRYSAARILEAGRKYLADKPGWQTPRMMVHWLGSDPCLDPLLPLRAEPRLMAAEAQPPAAQPPGDPDAYARSVGFASAAERVAALEARQRREAG